MKMSIHPLAGEEMVETAAYYNSQLPGLGREFMDELDAALRRVSEFPEASAMLSGGTRRCLLRRFPYGLIYKAKSDCILVMAVAHLHRRPGYWRSRM